MSYRLFAPLALAVLLPSAAFAQTFTLAELKAFNAMTPDAFKEEIKRQGFSFEDRTATSEVSMITYYKYVNDHNTSVMKFTYAKRTDENAIQLTLTDKPVFDSLVKAVHAEGYAPAGKGRIPGGEVYQDMQRKNEKVRIVTAEPGRKPLGRPSYTLLVWTDAASTQGAIP